jgi:hypothetical protein
MFINSRTIIYFPDTAHQIPNKGTIVWFVFVTTQPLEIMSNSRVDIALNRNTLLPIRLTVLLGTLFEMLSDLEEHGALVCQEGIPTIPTSKIGKTVIQKTGVAIFLEAANILEHLFSRGIDHQTCHNLQRHQIAAAFTLTHIPNSTGLEFCTVTRVFYARVYNIGRRLIQLAVLIQIMNHKRL